MSRKAKLRTLEEKQLTLNAKVLTANGEKHPRQKLIIGMSKLASQTKSLNKQQMKKLSLWFFTDKDAKNVESELRERLLKSPRVKAFEERWTIALLCVLQVKNNKRISVY